VYVGALTTSVDLNSQKYLLWKRGGHPAALRDQRLQNLYDQLRSLCINADPTSSSWFSFDDHVAFYLDENHKRMVLEALCTVIYLDQVGIEANNNCQELFQSLIGAVDVLLKQFREAEAKLPQIDEGIYLYVCLLADINSLLFLDEEVEASDKKTGSIALKKLFSHLPTALLPLGEYSSIFQEMGLIQSIQSALASMFLKRSFSGGFENVNSVVADEAFKVDQ